MVTETDGKRYDHDDFEGEERVLVRTPEGRAAVLPKSAGRLRGEALEAYADLMSTGSAIAQLEEQLDELVDQAREAGVSWSLIGAAVGLTSEGARKRFGGARD